jgi:DNA-binding NtrC family response regulator
VVPVGANTPVPIDVRVITGDQRAARRARRRDDVRQDLLYRLNTVEIEVPPLRERPGDIPLLAEHFMRVYARKYGRPVEAIAEDAMAAIAAYAWPGNVRALRHALERAIILCDGRTLRLADFPLPPVESGKRAPVEPSTLAELERQAIIQALDRHAGNITYAAEELGITRTSLYRRMEKHGL